MLRLSALCPRESLEADRFAVVVVRVLEVYYVMSKNGGRFSRLSVLAPAALSACMDASVLAVPAAGAIVSTVLKELSKAFMLKKWFHGIMSAKEAEHLIMEKGKNGSYLVRESQAHPGQFVLSVRVRGRVTHVMITKQDDKYTVGSGEQFDDLVGLIEHFRSYPITGNSGDVLRLLQPVSGTKLRAQDINIKVQEMQDVDNNEKAIHRNGFDGEFQSLNVLEERQVFTTNEGIKPENLKKNRYVNILPYDHTRVKLRRCHAHCRSDYINANFVRCTSLYDSSASFQSSNESLNSVHSLILPNEPNRPTSIVTKSLSDEVLKDMKLSMNLDKINVTLNSQAVNDKVYIATQGCLSNTKEDFWRMIWQEDVRVIVMITNEYEKGKKKCERYWPLANTEEVHDDLHVRLNSETEYEDYLLRELAVRDDNMCHRTIYQYHFTAWPDHSTPIETRNLLNFIEDINLRLSQISKQKDSPEQKALCVHCSAGVGRTGSFIVLDMLIDKIKVSGLTCNIDVHNTVKLVRAQRGGSVQNKLQYRFIYLALQDFMDSRRVHQRKKVYTSHA